MLFSTRNTIVEIIDISSIEAVLKGLILCE